MSPLQPVASLPMYDWPEVQWANDALWEAIRARLESAGIEAPATLDRSRDRYEVWTDPGLVLAQTCAWPFVTRLRTKTQLVATPIYDVEGCAGGLYSSFLVARADDPGDSLGAFTGQRFAINSRDSLSGYVALRAAMGGAGVDSADVQWIETGGHRSSIRAVAEGAADLAAIDAICWALACRHEAGAVERLRIVNRTPLRPGLPLITSSQSDAGIVAGLQAALRDALATAETLAARQALFFAGIDQIEEQDYAALVRLAPGLELPKPFTVTLSGPEGPYTLSYTRNRDEGALDVVMSGVHMEWAVDVCELGQDGRLRLAGMTLGTKPLWSDVYWFELIRGPETKISFYGDRTLIRTDYLYLDHAAESRASRG